MSLFSLCLFLNVKKVLIRVLTRRIILLFSNNSASVIIFSTGMYLLLLWILGVIFGGIWLLFLEDWESELWIKNYLIKLYFMLILYLYSSRKHTVFRLMLQTHGMKAEIYPLNGRVLNNLCSISRCQNVKSWLFPFGIGCIDSLLSHYREWLSFIRIRKEKFGRAQQGRGNGNNLLQIIEKDRV